MVIVSKYNNNVCYNEYTSVYDDDDDLITTIYKKEIMGEECNIILGNKKKNKNIYFYPIYLLCPGNKFKRIGIFELNPDVNYYDKNGELDINKLTTPIYFYFVNPDFLKNNEQKKEGGWSGGGGVGVRIEYDPIPEQRKDIFIQSKYGILPKKLRPETKEDAIKERNKYIERKGGLWIQKYMKNMNYSVEDNEGGGDCFFATIRDAFSSIGQHTTVLKLRKKLSLYAKEDVFVEYRQLYESILNEMMDCQKKIKEEKERYDRIKQALNSATNLELKKKIYYEGRELAEKIKKLENDLIVSKELIGEFSFIKNAKTLQEFQKFIQTSNFWAEMWSISLMEEILNIKFIIFSAQNYNNKDYNNVLLCGNLNENLNIINPEYYIIIEYTGNHYRLVGYKNKVIFTLSELPFDLKGIIKNKCNENIGGNFCLIPEFAVKRKGGGQVIDVWSSNLFDNAVVFIFDSPTDVDVEKKIEFSYLPGKAPGESISNQKIIEFSFLATIPRWRKKLGNNWLAIIEVDQKHWATVEHYLQANKFKMARDPSFYELFTLESKSSLSKNPEMAIAAGSKSGKYLGTQLRPLNIDVDAKYEKNRYLEKALTAKFTQHPDLKRLLLETKNAKLMEYQRGKEPELAEILMIVRKKIESL